MSVTMNGSKATTDLQQFELISPEPQQKPEKAKRVRTTTTAQNPQINCNLILDAGSKRIKSVLNGQLSTIDSIYKEVKGDLPHGLMGCFRYKGKNYVVGRGSESLWGEMVESHTDNKLKKLDIWLLGALSSDVNFLDEQLANKKNRYKSKPIRLMINLKLLSLSSNKVGDITKILQGINSFEYQGREFTIQFKNLNSDYIFSEGYGAALTAVKLISGDVDNFAILDLGGGTLTLTSYRKGKQPKVTNRDVASGGGMQELTKHIFISLNKMDFGGETKSLDFVNSALRACKPLEGEEFLVPYRLGNKTINIAESVIDGLSKWVSDNPSIADILSKASQILINGGSVFCTGGGFASPIIAHKLRSKIINEVSTGQFEVLDNPQSINVMGMLDYETQR